MSSWLVIYSMDFQLMRNINLLYSEPVEIYYYVVLCQTNLLLVCIWIVNSYQIRFESLMTVYCQTALQVQNDKK